MAKQDSGHLGGFCGKLGPAVGYMWNGKWCLRSRPGQVRNPRTDKQMEQRSLFSQEVQLAARMRQAVIAGLTGAARQEGMTAYNLFVSVNQQAFSLDGNELQVDYSLLQLGAGPVAPVALGTPAVDGDNVLTVSFEANPLHMRADHYDRVMLYVYCPDAGRGEMALPVYRRTKRVGMALPDDFAGRELHVYAFAQDETGRCSQSVYAGPVALRGSAEPAAPVAVERPEAVAYAPAATVHPSPAAKAPSSQLSLFDLADDAFRTPDPPC